MKSVADIAQKVCLSTTNFDVSVDGREMGGKTVVEPSYNECSVGNMGTTPAAILTTLNRRGVGGEVEKERWSGWGSGDEYLLKVGYWIWVPVESRSWTWIWILIESRSRTWIWIPIESRILKFNLKIEVELEFGYLLKVEYWKQARNPLSTLQPSNPSNPYLKIYQNSSHLKYILKIKIERLELAPISKRNIHLERVETCDATSIGQPTDQNSANSRAQRSVPEIRNGSSS